MRPLDTALRRFVDLGLDPVADLLLGHEQVMLRLRAQLRYQLMTN